MFLLVTRYAKGNPVLDIIGQFGKFAPCLYVVGVKFFLCSAILAGLVITAKDSPSPLFVFVGSAATSCCLILFFSGCNLSTGWATVFRFQMTRNWKKCFPAFLTGKALPLPLAPVEFIGASIRTSLLPGMIADKRFLTYRANPAMALVTIRGAWVVCFKFLSAGIARMNGAILGWFGKLRVIRMFAAKLSCTCNLIFASREGAFFTGGHTSIIPRFAHLDRWHVMTGQMPELLTP